MPEILLVAADHDRERAVLGARLAARHRRIEKARAAFLGGGVQLAGDLAEAVVLSMATAPGFNAAKAPFGPSVTSRRSSSLPTQVKTKSASRAAAAGVGAAVPPNCGDPGVGALRACG